MNQVQIEREMTTFCMGVAKLYGLKLVVQFSNSNKSFHRYYSGSKTHLIRFGWASLRTWMTKGFNEYKSLEYLVPKPRPINMEAVWWLCCHELAHMVQATIPQGRTYGSVHNLTFINCYREIRELFPFSGLGYGSEIRAEPVAPVFLQTPVAQIMVAHASPTPWNPPSYARDRREFRAKVRAYLNSRSLDYAIRDGVYYVSSTQEIISYEPFNGTIKIA